MSLSAEQIYSEQGVDEDFEAAAEATAPVGTVAQTLDAAEPWLAVVDVRTAPRLVIVAEGTRTAPTASVACGSSSRRPS